MLLVLVTGCASATGTVTPEGSLAALAVIDTRTALRPVTAEVTRLGSSTVFSVDRVQRCRAGRRRHGAGPSDTFQYRASDGQASSAPTTVTIAVNRPPVARNDSMLVTMGYNDETFTFNVITGALGGGCCSGGESWSPGIDTDADGDSLTYVTPRSLSRPYWMTGFQCSAAGTCQITVKGCTGLASPWTYTYTVSDGRGGQDTATMSFRPVHNCIR